VLLNLLVPLLPLPEQHNKRL
jgi:hypothetical protein